MKLIWLIGPQAVGKMTIGKIIAEKTGYKLFYNHQSIELALNFFEYGTDGFNYINGGIRETIVDAMLKYSDTGLLFTIMLDFNDQNDMDYISKITQPFENNNWEIYYVELEADLETRLERNSNPDRIAAKPSKADQEQTKRRMIESMQKYKLNSDNELPFEIDQHILINTELYDKEKAADLIIKYCKM